MNWQTETLGKLCDDFGGFVQTGPFGSQLKQSEYIDDPNGVPVVMPKDIKEGRIDLESAARISEQKAQSLSRHFLADGDIIFPRRGDINKLAIVEHASSVFCGTGCLRIHTPSQGIVPKFLFYFLGQPKVAEWLEARAIGSTMLNLNTSIMRAVEVRFPDYQSQGRIASILSAYDDIIENNRRRIALLEDAARQLYKEWFVRFRFPGHEHVAMIDGVPEGWERAPASAVLNVLSGGTPKTTTAQFWDGDIGFFTPKDAVQGAYVSSTEKTITEEGLAKCNSKLYPKDTLFITARGTVGKMNLALIPMAMNQSCYALVSKSCLSQRMLYLTMDASLQQFRSQASGAVFDAIVVATFDRISVIKPDSKTADAFDELINPVFDQIANLGRQNEHLAKARDLLLPKLMNGTLTV